MASNIGASANLNTSFGDILGGIFGTAKGGTASTVSGELSLEDFFKLGTTQETGTKEAVRTGESTEQLKIDEEGILQLIENILKGTSGLAEIFSAEQGAGLFGSSVAKAGTEDLLAKIAGELALVTGVKTIKETGTEVGTEARTTLAEETGTTAKETAGQSAVTETATQTGIFDEMFGSEPGGLFQDPALEAITGVDVFEKGSDFLGGLF